jgi:hypothetical protein
MAYTSPYNYGSSQTPDGQTEDDQAPSTSTQQLSPTSGPATYTPSSSSYSPQQATKDTTSDPPQTFSQLQDQGIARPPAPSEPAPTTGIMQTTSAFIPPIYDAASPQSAPQQTLTYSPSGPDAPPEPAPTTAVTQLPATVQPPAYTGPAYQANFTAPTSTDPLAGLSEAQLQAYWAAKAAQNGDTGYLSSYGMTNPGISAGQYTNPSAVASNTAALAAQGRDLVGSVQAAQDQNIANYNAAANTFDNDNNLATWGQYATGLNSQPGYAGSGNPYLDPNQMPAWFTGNAPAPGAGGPQSPTIANPISGTYAPPVRPLTPSNRGTDTGGGQLPQATNPGSPGNPTGTPTTYVPPTGGTGGTTGGTGGAGGTTGPTTFTPSSNTGTLDLLKLLTQGAQGQGPGSAVQAATQQKALDLLNNPSPYGEQDVKDLYKYLEGDIQDQYDAQNRNTAEQMARRGLGTSTIYSDNLLKSNLAKRSAQETLGENLAQNYAQTVGNYQTNAVNTGNTVGNAAQNNAQSWLGQLMGYGQNAFTNDLATNLANQSSQNSWQNYVLGLLGLGYGGTPA